MQVSELLLMSYLTDLDSLYDVLAVLSDKEVSSHKLVLQEILDSLNLATTQLTELLTSNEETPNSGLAFTNTQE